MKQISEDLFDQLLEGYDWISPWVRRCEAAYCR